MEQKRTCCYKNNKTIAFGKEGGARKEKKVPILDRKGKKPVQVVGMAEESETRSRRNIPDERARRKDLCGKDEWRKGPSCYCPGFIGVMLRDVELKRENLLEGLRGDEKRLS